MNKLLIILFVTIIFKQLIWIAFVPLWHFPDEQAHFGQVAYSVEIGKPQSGPNLTKEILISERILQTERDGAGNNKYTYHPEYNIPYSGSLEGLYEKEIKTIPYEARKELVKSEATYYPPSYYLPLTAVYRIFSHQDIITRVFLARLVNIIYFLIIFWVCYKLFSLVFGDDLIAVSGAILVSFQPMFSFIQGGINSDNLFNLLFTFGIYLSLLIIKKGFKFKYLILLLINLFLAIKTKPQGNILLAIYFIPLFYFSIKNKSVRLPSLLILLSLIGSYVLNFISRKQLFFLPDTYVSEFVKKDLTLSTHISWSLKHTYREVIPWYWGVFRWLSLALPRIVNRVINRVSLVLVFGSVIYVIKKIMKKDFSSDFISFLFFIYCSFIYFLVIVVWDYLFTLTHGFSFGIQGRYFFPTISTQMGLLLFSIFGFTSKKRIQAILAIILASGMIILHEIVLFRVLSSYYSVTSLKIFFIQASQYKPWFFKSPFLEFVILLHFISLILFCYQLLRITSDEKSIV